MGRGISKAYNVRGPRQTGLGIYVKFYHFEFAATKHTNFGLENGE